MAEIISNINPERIQWCCQLVSLDIEELAAKNHINATKLATGQLTYNQLKKVSDFFGYTPLFFLESEPPIAEKIHTTAFRTLANQSVTLGLKLVQIIKQVEWHRDLYLDLMEELDEEIVSFKSPELTGTIVEKASAVRQWLGLESEHLKHQNYTSYRKLIEAKGILVFQSMGYNGDWQLKDSNTIGFSIPHPKVPVIFVKKTSPQMQSFTLFHELGHLLLHDISCIDNETQLNNDQSEKKEREANQFAGKCLLPDSLLPDSAPVGVENYDNEFQDLANQLGISVEVIVVALVQKGKISREDYSAYKDIKHLQRNEAQGETKEKRGSRAYRHREPRHIFGDNYVGTVLHAFHSKIVTLSKTSKYLDGLKVHDIKKLQDSF